jgi:hypothetical protein
LGAEGFNRVLTFITKLLTALVFRVFYVCSIKTHQMKKMIFVVILALGAGIATAQQVTASKVSVNNETTPSFKWDEQVHDFGKIAKGVPVTHEFQFTNNGGGVLLIADVKPSCGCTTPEWTRTPIQSGETGFIKATYNAASPGSFSKTISVTSNTGAPITLTIKGVVE